jgi:hypothetical protein
MTDTPKELSAYDLEESIVFLSMHDSQKAANLERHIGALTTRIAELTKPVGGLEIEYAAEWVRTLKNIEAGKRIEDLLTRLARENAALKHDIDRYLTITEQQAGEIIAAEQALESAQRALEEIVALPPMGQDELSLTYRLRDIAKRALAQPKMTP